MSKKIILTTEQSTLIINHILNEMVNEGAWENVKYGLSKLGRYKAGGKILGKDKIDADAKAKIEAILEKTGNEVIKKLDQEIKSTNPEFPNNRVEVRFINTIMDIAIVYDSLVEATKLPPADKGYLPVDAANAIITDLREYVKKFLDVDLKSIYSVVDEVEGIEVNLSENEIKQIEEDIASKTRQGLQSRRGDGEEFQSDRMSTLKSNKLPMLLVGIGASLGAFQWLVNTEWFKGLFSEIVQNPSAEGIKQTITTHSDVINQIQPNEGLYKFLGSVTNHHLNANSKPEELINILKQISGTGDAHKGVDMLCQHGGIMMQPDQAKAGLDAFINDPSKYHNLNDLFHGQASGTGKIIPTNTTMYGTIAGNKLTTVLTNIITKSLPSIIAKTSVKVGAGYAAAKGLGAILGPIGVGILATGALVKAMRIKGQNQSRAKTLNDLYQSIRNLDGGVLGDQVPGEHNQKNGVDNDAVTDVPHEMGGFNQELYGSLKNLFKFIVSNKNSLGVRSADNVGTGAGASKLMKAGDKRLYKGKEVTVINPNSAPNRASVRYTDSKTPFAVKPQTLTRLSEAVLTEGRIIKDKRLYQFLTKNLSFDKLNAFEELISKVENIRNQIKRIDTSNDKVLAHFVNKIKTNPIIATDFVTLFNVSPDDPKAVNSLKAFIDDVFITLYSGKFKYNSMIDKMAGMGKVNEAGYNVDSPDKNFLKDAQDRRTFKKNLLAFLTDIIGLFQYLTKIKSQENTATTS